MDNPFGLLIVSLILLVIIIILGPMRERKLEKKINEARSATSYRLDKDTLYVGKRSSRAPIVLSIHALKMDFTKYVPEKLHVGAVTIGNVTSGGVYKTGGYNQLLSGTSEKCVLLYLGNEIKKIVLTDELASEAQKSYIKEYMSNNSIIVVDEVKKSPAFVALMSAGRISDANNVYQLDKADAYPSRTKCEAIVRWLSGNGN